MMLRRALLAACLAACGTVRVAVAQTYDYADTTGFTINAFPSGTTPAPFAFPAAGGPIDMTRTTTLGTGLSLTTRTVTYSGSAPYDNPAWIAGTRNFFGINDSGTGANPVITFTSAFTAPLQTSSYLVFTDVEFGEKIYVRAYSGTSLIPFGDLAFTKWNGNSTSGTSVNTTWNVEAGYSGLLLSGTPFGFSNPVVTLQSAQPISSLEYTIDMGSATNSLGFNFAVPVPEPTTLTLAASASVGAMVWRRRRR
jgi:hypothetical protein